MFDIHIPNENLPRPHERVLGWRWTRVIERSMQREVKWNDMTPLVMVEHAWLVIRYRGGLGWIVRGVIAERSAEWWAGVEGADRMESGQGATLRWTKRAARHAMLRLAWRMPQEET